MSSACAEIWIGIAAGALSRTAAVPDPQTPSPPALLPAMCRAPVEAVMSTLPSSFTAAFPLLVLAAPPTVVFVPVIVTDPPASVTAFELLPISATVDCWLR